jgi:3'(2'), 5'-bisphosphate nucleotidase
MFYKNSSFIEDFKCLIEKCNEIILEIYQKDFDVIIKEDKSPLTQADKKSNDIIVSYLINLNKKLIQETNETFTIISEESKKEEYKNRKECTYTWLVDPIDGTKEFIKKNGQFTVNIGLAKNGTPVFGIVSIPVSGFIYIGIEGLGSFKYHKNISYPLKVLKNKDVNKKNIIVVASASHCNQETLDFISKLNEPKLTNIGSSIKLLTIAENNADIYPRYAPTSEWDTCAAHAVVKYAGGRVLNAYSNEELTYNKENLLNPYFIVF